MNFNRLVISQTRPVHLQLTTGSSRAEVRSYTALSKLVWVSNIQSELRIAIISHQDYRFQSTELYHILRCA